MKGRGRDDEDEGDDLDLEAIRGWRGRGKMNERDDIEEEEEDKEEMDEQSGFFISVNLIIRLTKQVVTTMKRETGNHLKHPRWGH